MFEISKSVMMRNWIWSQENPYANKRQVALDTRLQFTKVLNYFKKQMAFVWNNLCVRATERWFGLANWVLWNNDWKNNRDLPILTVWAEKAISELCFCGLYFNGTKVFTVSTRLFTANFDLFPNISNIHSPSG